MYLIIVGQFNLKPLTSIQVIESTEKGNEAEQEGQARTVRISQLNLVDLAGSERAKSTGI